MSGISPIDPSITVTPIIQVTTLPANDTIGGFALAGTTLVFGTILFLIMITYIFMIVFGQPMAIAKKTAMGGSMIQHFNTSKSAQIKDATISGGAFRYHNIRDGTVAATVGSVNNVGGRNIVLTFAQLGVTIPIPILGGISILVHNGINNINELRKHLAYTEVYTEKILNPETGLEEKVEVGRSEKMKNEIIVHGYNFDNFEVLLKQSQEEKFIPLVIEAVPDFVERNISADITEKKIKIRQLLNTHGEVNFEHLKMMTIAIAVIAIFFMGMFIK